MIRFACQQCQHPIECDEELIGLPTICPNCDGAARVPQSPDEWLAEEPEESPVQSESTSSFRWGWLAAGTMAALLIVGATAVLWLRQQFSGDLWTQSPPQSESQSAPKENSKTIVPKKAPTKEPPKKDVAKAKSDDPKKTSQPPKKKQPAKSKELSWRGWTIRPSPDAAFGWITEEGISGVPSDDPTARFMTGGAKVTLTAEKMIADKTAILRIQAAQAAISKSAGKIIVHVNGKPVVNIVVNDNAGRDDPFLVPLKGHKGKAKIDVVFAPDSETAHVEWSALRIESIPPGRIEPLPGTALVRFRSPVLVVQQKSLPVVNARLPRAVAICERPELGQYRYLRFAYRSKTGKGIHAALNPFKKRGFQYFAGDSAAKGNGIRLWQAPIAREWIIVTRDLFADFGAFDLSTLAMQSATGGEVEFDHIMLARNLDDMNPHRRKRWLSPAQASKIEHIATTSLAVFKAMQAMVVIDTGDYVGGGVIVSKEGLIATTGRVAAGAKRKAIVTLYDGRRFQASLLGLDRGLNAAALRLEGNGPFPHAPLDVGWPRGALFAFAPAGAWRAFPVLVSTQPRVRGSIGGLAWTNANILPQHSGGALITNDGRFVGLHGQRAPLGGGLHVPTSRIFSSWSRMVKSERWGRWNRANAPVIGANVKSVQGKCIIDRVIANHPAANAGLKIGDKIKSVGGETVKSLGDLHRILAMKDPGDAVAIIAIRNGKSITVELRLKRR